MGTVKFIFFFGCVLSPAGLYLLFIILVKHSSLTLFKTVCATCGALYQEASGYKIYICVFSNFVLSLFLICFRGSERVELNF